MQIYDVQCNGLENPIGYDFKKIRVSWKVKEAKGKKQELSRIEVSNEEGFDTLVYQKEGKLNALSEELDITLEPYTRYYFRVFVCSDQKEEAVSETCFFETAKMNDAWEAKWISTQAEDIFHPVLAKKITTQKSVKSARLYITGLGLFEAYIDGIKAGEDILAPFISDYENEVQYCTYDVTSQLKQKDGEHQFEIYLGNGWYKGRFGFFPADPTKRFLCIAELRCEYEDGSKDVFVTDESWQYRGSIWELTDIYDGETQNELLWEENDNPWKPVEISEKEPTLTARQSLPLQVMETLPVKELIHTPAGEWVLDFGQNFAGYVECSPIMKKGQTLKLEFGEILQDGNFYHDNYRTAKSVFTYISNGEPKNIYPHFTFFGFRYVKVSGLDQVCADDFKGRVVYSKMNQIGEIKTSDSKINRLIANSLWGLKSNFLEMPTDCPQRDERLGWTGDAMVFCRTAGYHMDTKAFYQKFLRELRLDQVQHDGQVAVYLPNTVPGMTSCVWSDIATFLPRMLYEYYGDIEALKENYPMMKDWVDRITRDDEQRGAKHLWDFGFQFGDWVALDGPTEQSRRGRTDSYYVSSVYYYASTSYVADAAEILGYPEASEYRALAEKIKKAILQEYFTPTGRLAIDTQTGYFLALKFGIYTDKEKLIQAMQKRIKEDCHRIKGGFVGATMMNVVLADSGLERLAYDFLFFEGFPGWLYQVNLGATTIWERWNCVLPDGKLSGTEMHSLNHYSYGAVVEFLYRNAAGITAATPGFKKARLAPKPDGRLKTFSCQYDSAAGLYQVEWEILKSGEIHLKFVVPFDAEAEIILPECDEKPIQVQAGTYEYTYMPKRDYRYVFDENTRMEFMVENPEAKKVLEKYMPNELAAFYAGTDEDKAKSILDLKKYALVLHAPTAHLDAAVEALKNVEL